LDLPTAQTAQREADPVLIWAVGSYIGDPIMIEASILRAAETERLHAVAAVEAAAVAAERARAERARADIAVAAAERLAQWEESAPRRARAAAAESRLAAAQWAATQATSAGETGAGEAGAVAPREPAAVPEGTASAEFATTDTNVCTSETARDDETRNPARVATNTGSETAASTERATVAIAERSIRLDSDGSRSDVGRYHRLHPGGTLQLFRQARGGTKVQLKAAKKELHDAKAAGNATRTSDAQRNLSARAAAACHSNPGGGGRRQHGGGTGRRPKAASKTTLNKRKKQNKMWKRKKQANQKEIGELRREQGRRQR
jgi:hypothetical protein